MDSPPPPVSPPTSYPHGQSMMRMPPGAPPPPGPGGAYGAPSPPMSSHGPSPPHHGMPPPHHQVSGPPSSNGGSRPPSMPGSPASGVSSHGYHSGHSGPASPYGHGPPPTHHGGMSPHSMSPGAASANSPRGMNTPSPPPHQIGGLAGSKVTPDAAARVAHAKATGEPPVGPPTWRRMPCKARSVPDGHTAETAYLTIPPNAQHGLVLACSHPECRQSGKRFRFCAVCDLPVAKRNFLKRHSHGLVTAARSPRTDDDEDEEALEEKSSPMNTTSDGEKKGDDFDEDSSNSKKSPISQTKSDVGGAIGPSAPTSRGSAFAGSQYKRQREAGSTPPRDSDLDREGGGYPPYHGGPPINQAMSWPPHAEGQHPAYHPGVDSAGRDAAGRLGLSPYQPQGQGYRGGLHGHPQGYGSPPGSHQMHHIPPHNYSSPQGMGPPPPHAHHPGAPYHSPPGTEYAPPGNASGAFRGLPPNHAGGGGTSSGGPSPHPEMFEPPQPEYSVMRLSRREREWLQLYRARPDSSDRDATNEWVNKCLSYSEPLAETHDGDGGGVEAVLRDRSSSHATGKHSASTVHAKTVVTPPGSEPKAKSSSDGPANVSHDTSGDLPAAGDDLDLSPCRPRNNTGGSLSTLSMTGESVTELLEHAGLMDADLGDMPLVDDPGRGSLKVGDRSVSSGDVSPISNHGAEPGFNGTKRGSFRGSPENAPPMPSLGGKGYPNGSVRDSLQHAKIEGQRAAASGRSSTRPSSPHAGADTPVNMDAEPSWGCSFLPPLCGAFNM